MSSVPIPVEGSRAAIGGNRLGPGHPAFGRTPAYQRIRDWPADPERRDRNQRRRIRIAADEAARAGELPAVEHRALMALLSFCDDRCSRPVYPSLATIARSVHGDDRYGPAGEHRGGRSRPSGQRTAGRWIRRLVAKGWVVRRHCPPVRESGGRLRWLPSEYRVQIPDRWRNRRHQAEDRGRAARSGRASPAPASGTSRTGPPGRQQQGREARATEPSPSLVYAAADAHRRARELEVTPVAPAVFRDGLSRARAALASRRGPAGPAG